MERRMGGEGMSGIQLQTGSKEGREGWRRKVKIFKSEGKRQRDLMDDGWMIKRMTGGG